MYLCLWKLFLSWRSREQSFYEIIVADSLVSEFDPIHHGPQCSRSTQHDANRAVMENSSFPIDIIVSALNVNFSRCCLCYSKCWKNEDFFFAKNKGNNKMSLFSPQNQFKCETIALIGSLIKPIWHWETWCSQEKGKVSPKLAIVLSTKRDGCLILSAQSN